MQKHGEWTDGRTQGQMHAQTHTCTEGVLSSLGYGLWPQVGDNYG